MADALRIVPEAVRVWRGYRASAMSPADFFGKLGSVFIPATVKMQIEVGLDGYIPSIPAGLPDKPDSVPDETAILFWESQQSYADGFNTLAVRTYTLTHNAVYRPPSGADFPVLFSGSLEAEKPHYLFDRPADWMKGSVQQLVGSRQGTQSPSEFRKQLAVALSVIQSQSALPGAIVCAGDDYLVYWELAGPNSKSGIDQLAKLLNWSHRLSPIATSLDKGLWDVWPGMTVKSGDSFNMQFKRRRE